LELYLILASSFAVSSYFIIYASARKSAITVVGAEADPVITRVLAFSCWVLLITLYFPLLLAASLVDHNTLYDTFEEAQVEILVEEEEGKS